MSPRAAWRLERFGFEVYDYTAGKADWLAAGLPTERAAPGPARAIDAVDRDFPTCGPDARADEVLRVLRAANPSVCLVLNEHQVVVGRLRLEDVEDASPDVAVEQLMEPGPPTVRADADLDQTRQRLRDRHVASIVVTTPEGELLGLLHAQPARA